VTREVSNPGKAVEQPDQVCGRLSETLGKLQATPYRTLNDLVSDAVYLAFYRDKALKPGVSDCRTIYDVSSARLAVQLSSFLSPLSSQSWSHAAHLRIAIASLCIACGPYTSNGWDCELLLVDCQGKKPGTLCGGLCVVMFIFTTSDHDNQCVDFPFASMLRVRKTRKMQHASGQMNRVNALRQE